MLCAIIDTSNAKWATVIDGRLLGESKHKDYSVFHWKARDVQALKKQPITKFVFIDAAGTVEEVILAEDLKQRGQNYKTAKRDKTELTDLEREEVARAVEVTKSKPAAAGSPTPPFTTEQPKALLSAAAYALGLPLDQVNGAVAEGAEEMQSGAGKQAEPIESIEGEPLAAPNSQAEQAEPAKEGEHAVVQTEQTEQTASVDGGQPEATPDRLAARQGSKKKSRR